MAVITSFWRQREGDMVEAALTMPLMVLLALVMVNFALVGQARNAAQHAADVGARMGSVAFTGAKQQARDSAEAALQHCVCDAQVVKVSASDSPGGEVQVEVEWTVDNYMQPLMQFFGSQIPDQFRGTATATYRKEGW